MSGIAGLFRYDGAPVSRLDVSRMTDAIRHRGPDGCRTWHEGSTGLGHCALHTTPEARYEQLPRADPAGRSVLTADARIDNRDELMHLLDLRAGRDCPVTDADIILAAYGRWGSACPEHLVGDFAFTIWDEAEQHLFCARDQMGIRPFYYAHIPGRCFAFGSEIKALLTVEGVTDRLNERRIAEHLLNRIEDDESTTYADVLRLPPAHWMLVSRDGLLRKQRYWSLNPEYDVRFASDAEYVEGFLNVFTEAVRCRLRSPSPTGVLLSGGLDSSSVACVARDTLRESGEGSLHTFTATFPGLPPEDLAHSDERHYVEAIIAGGHVDAHPVPVDAASPLTDIERILWHTDQPCYVRNIYLDVLLHREARRHGVRVLLDGLEGDDAVSHGYAYLGEMAFNGRWREFAVESAALAGRTTLTTEALFDWMARPFIRKEAERGSVRSFWSSTKAIQEHLGIARRALVWEYLLKPYLASPYRVAQRYLRHPSTLPARRNRLLTPALARQLQTSDPPAKRDTGTYAYSAKLSHGRALEHPSVALFLEEGNHFAAAGGVETRHPFYDPRVLAYCVALPPDQKLRNGWTRFILRESMRGILPESIRTRTDKASLSPNFARNLLQMEDQRIVSLLDDAGGLLAQYVNLDTVRNAYRAGHVEAIWPVIQLGCWLGMRSTPRTFDTSVHEPATTLQAD